MFHLVYVSNNRHFTIILSYFIGFEKPSHSRIEAEDFFDEAGRPEGSFEVVDEGLHVSRVVDAAAGVDQGLAVFWDIAEAAPGFDIVF